MPSALPLPTTRDFERAFHAAVGAERKLEDAHDGSLYDRWAGVGALCMRRLVERDQGEARAIFFDGATDDRLDSYIEQHFDLERTQNAPGVGTAQLSRASATAGPGTFLKGTRVQVGRGGGVAPSYWSLSADVPAGTTDLTATVPIVASVDGPAGQVSLAAGDVPQLSLADPLWDNTWQVTRIDCAPGTLRQEDPAVRATIRQQRIDGRPGYETAIINAMRAAGASVVALYQSDFLGDSLDVGLNRIYVGDTGYESPIDLLRRCRLAVFKVGVAGTSIQVLPMTNNLLTVSASVRLWNSPERLNQVQAQADAVDAITEYFARRDNAFLWSELAIRAAVMKAVKNVHSVTLDVSSPEPTLLTLFDTVPLQRYRVAGSSVSATVLGPV